MRVSPSSSCLWTDTVHSPAALLPRLTPRSAHMESQVMKWRKCIPLILLCLCGILPLLDRHFNDRALCIEIEDEDGSGLSRSMHVDPCCCHSQVALHQYQLTINSKLWKHLHTQTTRSKCLTIAASNYSSFIVHASYTEIKPQIIHGFHTTSRLPNRRQIDLQTPASPPPACLDGDTSRTCIHHGLRCRAYWWRHFSPSIHDLFKSPAGVNRAGLYSWCRTWSSTSARAQM